MTDYDADDLKQATYLDDVTEWLEEVTSALDEGHFQPTAWEVDFLESIWEELSKFNEDDEAEEEQPLTGAQLVSLKQICDKVT